MKIDEKKLLSENEISNVSGGCGPSSPSLYNVNDEVYAIFPITSGRNGHANCTVREVKTQSRHYVYYLNYISGNRKIHTSDYSDLDIEEFGFDEENIHPGTYENPL